MDVDVDGKLTRYIHTETFSKRTIEEAEAILLREAGNAANREKRIATDDGSAVVGDDLDPRGDEF